MTISVMKAMTTERKQLPTAEMGSPTGVEPEQPLA